jgi:hypothetical protein
MAAMGILVVWMGASSTVSSFFPYLTIILTAGDVCPACAAVLPVLITDYPISTKIVALMAPV